MNVPGPDGILAKAHTGNKDAKVIGNKVIHMPEVLFGDISNEGLGFFNVIRAGNQFGYPPC